MPAFYGFHTRDIVVVGFCHSIVGVFFFIAVSNYYSIILFRTTFPPSSLFSQYGRRSSGVDGLLIKSYLRCLADNSSHFVIPNDIWHNDDGNMGPTNSIRFRTVSKFYVFNDGEYRSYSKKVFLNVILYVITIVWVSMWQLTHVLRYYSLLVTVIFHTRIFIHDL